MILRQYTAEDYDAVALLFAECEQQIPSQEELNGYAIVAKEDGEVVGFIWALVGDSATAFVDHLMVRPDNRKEKDLSTGRSVVAITLGMKMMVDLAEKGITRIVATVMDDIYGPCLSKIYRDIGMEAVSCLCIVRGNPEECSRNLHEKTKWK